MAKQITSIDRTTLRLLCDEMNAALAPLAKKYGLAINTNGASYNAANATVKVSIATIGDSGEAITRESDAYTLYAEQFGLRTDALGETFEHKGEQYKIIGLAPRRPKFPVLAIRVRDGARIKFPAETVARTSVGLNAVKATKPVAKKAATPKTKAPAPAPAKKSTAKKAAAKPSRKTTIDESDTDVAAAFVW